MKNILLTLLLHPSKYNYGKAIKLTKEILKRKGYNNLPCDLTFKRYAENFRKNNYAEWILRREGMKAYHDKVEPYIERDISKIDAGNVPVSDGHVLNFQVINPFTGKPTRATLVGFLDWNKGRIPLCCSSCAKGSSNGKGLRYCKRYGRIQSAIQKAAAD